MHLYWSFMYSYNNYKRKMTLEYRPTAQEKEKIFQYCEIDYQ
jgi:hypothetical protein